MRKNLVVAIAVVLVLTGCSSGSGRGKPVITELDATPSSAAPAPETPAAEPEATPPAQEPSDLNAACPAEPRAVFERQRLIFLESTDRIEDPEAARMLVALRLDCVFTLVDGPVQGKNSIFAYYFDLTADRTSAYTEVLSSSGFVKRDGAWRSDDAGFVVTEIDYEYDAAAPIQAFLGPELKRDFTVLAFTLDADD